MRHLREGDAVAIGILRGSADQLESSALSVARRLDMTGGEFPFVLAGGIFRAVPWLHEELDRRLPLASPRSRTIVLRDEPAERRGAPGAGACARRHLVPAYKMD